MAPAAGADATQPRRGINRGTASDSARCWRAQRGELLDTPPPGLDKAIAIAIVVQFVERTPEHMPPLGWRKHKDGKQAKGAAAPKTPKEPNKSSATSTLQAALFDLMTRHNKASCTFTEIYQHITRWFRPYSSSDIKFALNTVLLNTLSPSWLTEELKNGKRHYKVKDNVLERMKVARASRRSRNEANECRPKKRKKRGKVAAQAAAAESAEPAEPAERRPKKRKKRGKVAAKAAAPVANVLVAADAAICASCSARSVVTGAYFYPFCSRFCQTQAQRTAAASTGPTDAAGTRAESDDAQKSGTALDEWECSNDTGNPTPSPADAQQPRSDAPAAAPRAMPSNNAAVGFSDRHEDGNTSLCSIEVHVEFGAWNLRPIKFNTWPEDNVSRVAEAVKAAMCWNDIELRVSDGVKVAKGTVAMDVPLESLPPTAGREYVLLRAAEVMELDSDSD